MEQEEGRQQLKQLRRTSREERVQAYRRRVERRIKAVELRNEGKSYRAIAVELGTSLTQAVNDVKVALAPLNKREREMAPELRQTEAQRLDMAAEAIRQQVAKGDLPAVDRWITVSARRAKLMGLDMPPEPVTKDEKDPQVTIQVRYVDDIKP